MFLLKFWRETTILILSGILILGYNLWPEPQAPKVEYVEKEKIVVKEKIITKTVTKKPDGTIIEETKESTKDTKTKTDKVDTVAGGPSSRYSVVLLTPIRAPTKPEVVVGAQLGNLPVEAFTGYDFDTKSVKAGLGIRF